MVEQVRVNPEEVRGYGNICEGHTLEDFIVSNSGLAKEKENVHGALTDVYKLVYTVYGLMFDFDKGNKQLYLQTAEADTLSFGFDTANKQLYLVDEDDTGLWLVFDEDTHELYITDEAPPSISISASSPYLVSGETTDLIVTLYDGVGAPLANKSVTISDGTSVYNGITNNLGIFTLYDITVSEDTTFTATYSSVTDTVLVEYCDFVDYAVTNQKNNNWTNYSNRLTVTVDENGTLLNKGSSNGYYFVNNAQFIYSDYICEFDIVEVEGQAHWYHQASSTSTQDVINFASYNVNGKHIKMICSDGVMKVYADGNQLGSDISLTTSTPFEMGFRINTSTTQDRYIKYKNFRLHTL